MDYFFIMTYDWHWPGGPPGPIALINQVRATLDYAVKTFWVLPRMPMTGLTCRMEKQKEAPIPKNALLNLQRLTVPRLCMIRKRNPLAFSIQIQPAINMRSGLKMPEAF